MKDFLDIINDFEPITLEKMSQVALLDRIDTKFIFHRDKLNDILLEAKKNYRVLEINKLQYSDYETSYFDTENYKFYHDHHNQRGSRYKVRTRSYVNSDLHFFEIKHKSNQGRTIKSRVQIPCHESIIEGEAAKLLHKKVGISSELLKKTIQINCKRATLVNKQLTERVTIDFDMKYFIDDEWHTFPEVVIVEVKQNKTSDSLFLNIMREKHIRSESLSKYSFGVANFITGIKKNNFKTQLSYVHKICKQNAV